MLTIVCWRILPPAGIQERDVAGRPIQMPTDGYASSQTCRACHPSQYASWHGSYHRTMTQVATRDTVTASFDGVTVDAVPGEPIVLEQRGQELWAEFADPDDDPTSTRSTSGRITRQVVMITGSHHQQIYWYATGDSRVLGQLPAIWLTADRRWIPRRAAIMSPPGRAHAETGAWNGVCVACHATNGQPRFDTPFGSQPIAAQTADTRAAEFGVACEACHGPGAEHVRANRSPLRRYARHLTRAPDPTIVQPIRLTPRLSSQVCGQCHAFWEFADPQRERQANAQGLPYRPGDELSATRFLVQPTQNLNSPTTRAFLTEDPGFIRDIFWSDGMVRATGREYNGLIDSPCYKNATDEKRTLTCFSCHTMHKTEDDARAVGDWADDQLAPRAAGNEACVQCHTVLKLRVAPDPRRATPTPRVGTSIEAHTHHRADSAGSSCYNCHMPYTTYGLLKTIRSHQISNPSVRATLETGRPNACNLCHLDKTLAWTAEYLDQWYGTPKPPLGDDQRSVAASLLALLEGDAGQRAIVAHSMGWAPAQQASGSGWLAPYLALLSKDTYDAVRYIAARSMSTLPAFRGSQLPRGNPQLLIKADGTFDTAVVNRLVRARDNRRVVYRE
jgi:Cytochrome c552/Cytochrome c554 and c-prime